MASFLAGGLTVAAAFLLLTTSQTRQATLGTGSQQAAAHTFVQAECRALWDQKQAWFYHQEAVALLAEPTHSSANKELALYRFDPYEPSWSCAMRDAVGPKYEDGRKWMCNANLIGDGTGCLV